MQIYLDFEKEETKKLLSKLDFEFFLKQDIEANQYNEKDIETVYDSFRANSEIIKEKLKKDGKQYNYYLEGMVRKMFVGGTLPTLFHLSDVKKHTFFDFKACGENWAYFHCWQNYYKWKLTKNKIWDFIIKTGSILGIALSLQKLFEVCKPYFD